MKRSLLFMLVWLVGCAVAPPPGITPVTGFDLDRYLGRWYEIARLDHPFEPGLSNVSATYGLRKVGFATEQLIWVQHDQEDAHRP
jgi:apolipoprotein D and lipocalin family protein